MNSVKKTCRGCKKTFTTLDGRRVYCDDCTIPVSKYTAANGRRTLASMRAYEAAKKARKMKNKSQEERTLMSRRHAAAAKAKKLAICPKVKQLRENPTAGRSVEEIVCVVTTLTSKRKNEK